jgi:ubiquinone/menaquinone biosynthesis C-methylase UbiE
MTRALKIALIAAAIAIPGHPSLGQTRNDRLFPPLDLGLLEAPDRDEWQQPDRIMDALGIYDGAVVADLGVGSGWFTVRLARRVGPNGIVYAEDVQPEMIQATVRRVQREALRNVKPILGTEDDPKLPAQQIDAVLIVGIYHEIADPVALLRNVGHALKLNGRIGIIDFISGAGGPGPAAEERVEPEVILRSAEQAGLRLIKRETFLPFQYFLILGK